MWWSGYTWVAYGIRGVAPEIFEFSTGDFVPSRVSNPSPSLLSPKMEVEARQALSIQIGKQIRLTRAAGKTTNEKACAPHFRKRKNPG